MQRARKAHRRWLFLLHFSLFCEKFIAEIAVNVVICIFQFKRREKKKPTERKYNSDYEICTSGNDFIFHTHGSCVLYTATNESICECIQDEQKKVRATSNNNNNGNNNAKHTYIKQQKEKNKNELKSAIKQ